MLSTSGDEFVGFGKSKFINRRAGSEIELALGYREVRSQLRAECPESPGVYGMIDCAGRLVYVGMSRCLRKRTLTYFLQSEKQQQAGTQLQSANHVRKEARVASRAKRLVWETTGHELFALLREHELIRRFAPEMNVRDRRRRRLVYVFLSVEAAPRFAVGAQLPKSCRHHWGPVVKNRQLERAIDALNRQFHLPDCQPHVRMHFGDEPNLFDLELHPLCLRGEMNRCVAPCAGAITRNQYAAQINRARAFLDGRDDSPLDEIDRKILHAVNERRYEHAATLRDLRIDLTDLRDRLLPRDDLLPSSFVYAVERRGRTCWLAVHEATVLKVATAPRDLRTSLIWQTRLKSWRSAVMPLVDEREGGELQILAAWFRRHPTELGRVMDFDTAGRVAGRSA